MNQNIRNLQIDLIMDDTNSVIELFKDICNNIKIFESSVYHNNGGEYIYYNSNNEWVFFVDIESNRLISNYHTYWSIFEEKLKLKYCDIRLYTYILFKHFLDSEIPNGIIPSYYRKQKVVSILDMALKNNINKLVNEES